MYIALLKINGQRQYFLRESCTINDELTFRDIYDLGENPSAFIRYSGTNAFYFDDEFEYKVMDRAESFDSDKLEELFWPWLKYDVRMAVETFRGRAGNTTPKPSKAELEKIAATIHPFDKRRLHFLKFGSMDQGVVENMPPILFKKLAFKSRDEIEQYFLREEHILKAREYKSYVYTAFNLQQFFQGILAKTMPHALDQNKVDAFFTKEICRLNKALHNQTTAPHPYMIRYIIMFYDYLYADTTLLDEFAQAFMSRQRFYQPKPKSTVSTKTALSLFKISQTEFKSMDKKQLTRIYRKMARKAHPDTGGSDKLFVEINDAYNQLLEALSK